MNYLTFDEKLQNDYKLAILIKESALSKTEIKQYYIDPLLSKGFEPKDIIAFSLEHNSKDKAPVKLVREYLGRLEKILNKLSITNLLVTDANYFKVLCKVRKAEPHYGYVLQSILPGVQAALCINYQSLFYNPSLKERLNLGITAISKKINKEIPLFQQDLLGKIEFPSTNSEVASALQKLNQYPSLNCDIETYGLDLKYGNIATIAFSWNTEEGISFCVSFRHIPTIVKTRYKLLKDFFLNYQGNLTFHGSTFDTKILIRVLFMKDFSDIKGMLEGLHCLHKDLDDTKILAYLCTNTTAGNKLSLKDLAFNFAGNYAIEEIGDLYILDTQEVLNYNATDVISTQYVKDKYKPTVDKDHLEIYNNLFKPALKVLTQTELIGIPFDMDTVDEVNEELTAVADEHLWEIQNSEFIKHFEQVLRIETALENTSKLKTKIKTAEDYKDLKFNPNSNTQLRKFLFDHLELPVFRYTDTKLPSTDGKTLDGLIAWIKNRYEL